MLRHSLRAARPVLVAFHLPLVPLPGIIALCALFGGLVAVGGRALGIRAPGLSLVPATIVLVWSAILLPTTGAALAGLALGICGFLVLATDRAPDVRVSAGVAGVALALAALTLGWSAVAGSNEASPGGKVAPAVAPSALSLATDLTGVESRDADVVLFRVTPRVPDLLAGHHADQLRRRAMGPGSGDRRVLHGSAPVQSPVPAGDQRLFTAGVTLDGYSGRLLPAPPATISASGDPSPVVTSSGVAATRPVRVGTGYTVAAVVPSPVDASPQVLRHRAGTPPSVPSRRSSSRWRDRSRPDRTPHSTRPRR